MSNIIYGSESSIKKVQEIAAVVKGTKPFVKELPLSVPSIKGQRATKSSTLKKFLESEGCFNWSLWKFPAVVKVEESVARRYQDQISKEGDVDFAQSMEAGFLGDGFWYGRWDGDHRKHLWNFAFPDTEKTECMVYPVESVEVANELFVKIQKFNQKGLTPEDTVVNLYYGKEKNAVKTAAFLEYCGLAIKNSDEGIMPKTATLSTPTTKYRLFDRSVKECGLDETKMAVDIIVGGMKKNSKWNLEVSPTLMFGLAKLFKHRPPSMTNGLNKRLTQYIHDSMVTTPNQRLLITQWSRAGGDKHNLEAESLAYGLALSFRAAVSGGSYGGNLNITGPLYVSALDTDLGLKVA